MDTGPLPSEELLSLGRFARGVASRLQVELGMGAPDFKFSAVLGTKLYDELKDWMRLAGQLCAAGAPYYAYKLATMRVTGALPNLAAMSDDKLDEIERVASLLADGGRSGSNGEGSALN
jgi:hypothetical protein